MSNRDSNESKTIEGTPRSHVVVLRSPFSTSETLDRLATLAVARGLTVFARIEFSRDAAAAGITLAPMAQLVFGNPRAGTPVLAAAPMAGLDLPLRALAWTDDAGDTWLSYVDPDDLHARYRISRELTSKLEGIHALCRDAVADDSRSAVTDGG